MQGLNSGRGLDLGRGIQLAGPGNSTGAEFGAPPPSAEENPCDYDPEGAQPACRSERPLDECRRVYATLIAVMIAPGIRVLVSCAHPGSIGLACASLHCCQQDASLHWHMHTASVSKLNPRASLMVARTELA